MLRMRGSEGPPDHTLDNWCKKKKKSPVSRLLSLFFCNGIEMEGNRSAPGAPPHLRPWKRRDGAGTKPALVYVVARVKASPLWTE